MLGKAALQVFKYMQAVQHHVQCTPSCMIGLALVGTQNVITRRWSSIRQANWLFCLIQGRFRDSYPCMLYAMDAAVAATLTRSAS